MSNTGIPMERIKAKLGEKELYILLLENTVASLKEENDKLKKQQEDNDKQ